MTLYRLGCVRRFHTEIVPGVRSEKSNALARREQSTMLYGLLHDCLKPVASDMCLFNACSHPL